MTTAPLFVVVTPVYNGAKFIAEAMDAVQAQTYPNVLHIVLDNASTDATPDILKRYSNARVPVVVERNLLERAIVLVCSAVLWVTTTVIFVILLLIVFGEVFSSWARRKVI